MKVATLSGISDVKCRMALEPGNRVGIKHTGSVGTKNFTLQSVARDKMIWFMCLLPNQCLVASVKLW